MTEMWRYVVGFEGRYKVSSTGNVWSCVTNRILKQTISPAGYKRVGLYNEGKKQKKVTVHILVAKAFLPNWNENVNHKNGDKKDNRLENLEWVTISQNIKHAYATGLNTFPVGENHFNTKNNANEIMAIRIMYKTGKYKQKELASMFNLAQQTISTITNYGSWRSLK